MKKLLFLGVILFFGALFLIGCDVITIPYFVPDDGGMDEYDPQFISLLESLSNPLELHSWLSNNTQHETHGGNIYTPYEFYLNKKGICSDYSIFSCYVLHYNGYEVYNVCIYGDFSLYSAHSITVYKYKYGESYPGVPEATTGYYGYLNVDKLCLMGGFDFTFNNIEACAYHLADYMGVTIKSYEVNPWNYAWYDNPGKIKEWNELSSPLPITLITGSRN